VQVTLGSRQPDRAESVAKEVVAAWPHLSMPIGGADNEGASGAEVVVVATPWDSAIATVRPASLRGLVSLQWPRWSVNALASCSAQAPTGSQFLGRLCAEEMLPFGSRGPAPPRTTMASERRGALVLGYTKRMGRDHQEQRAECTEGKEGVATPPMPLRRH
jgi:hypothetical protein